MRILALWCVVTGLCLSAASGEITLESKDGKKMPAEVFSVTKKEADITVQRKRQKVQLDQLTEQSKAELIKYAKTRGVYKPFPPLRVEVKVPRKRRPTTGSDYMKDMTISPQITVEGTSVMEPIPPMQATMMIIAMDMREKFVNRREKHVVLSNETKEIPAAPGGHRRDFSFEASKVNYDGDRDDSNLGGFVYKDYICVLRDPETKEIVNFQTTIAPLQGFGKAHPEQLDKLLSLKKDSEFPADVTK